jgi:hypothetical protein
MFRDKQSPQPTSTNIDRDLARQIDENPQILRDNLWKARTQVPLSHEHPLTRPALDHK